MGFAYDINFRRRFLDSTLSAVFLVTLVWRFSKV